MEKIIKIFADFESYILMIDDHEIKINQKTKTLNSKDLYDYTFKGCTEPINLKFENHIEEFFASSIYLELQDENNMIQKKMQSESTFIFNKIQDLLKSVEKEINELFTIDEKNVESNERQYTLADF